MSPPLFVLPSGADPQPAAARHAPARKREKNFFIGNLLQGKRKSVRDNGDVGD